VPISTYNIYVENKRLTEFLEQFKEAVPEGVDIDKVIVDITSENDSYDVNVNMYYEAEKTPEELDEEIKDHNYRVALNNKREFDRYLELKEKFERNKNG
jgi:hypothetical protein